MVRNKIRKMQVQYPKIMIWIRRVSIALLLLGIFLMGWELSRIPWAQLNSYMPKSPWIAASVLLGIFAGKAILMAIPLNALYISASLLFLPGWAIAISYLGLLINMSVGFWMGRKWGSGQVRAKIEHYKYSRWLMRLTERHTVLSCMVFRFLPPPADMVNIFFGATRVRYTNFLFASLLGFTPKLLTIILLGEAATRSNPSAFLGIAGITLVVEFLPIGIIYLVNRKKINQEDQSAGQKP